MIYILNSHLYDWLLANLFILILNSNEININIKLEFPLSVQTIKSTEWTKNWNHLTTSKSQLILSSSR